MKHAATVNADVAEDAQKFEAHQTAAYLHFKHQPGGGILLLQLHRAQRA
jgi:hypothetical protein